MKILIITPIYYIEGRNKLFHDSSAVHYLVKPWAHEHDVHVICVYSQSLKTLSRYFSRSEREYYKNGYYYTVDNVKVALCELQMIKVRYESRYTIDRLSRFIERYLLREKFEPDVVVAHMPSRTVKAIEKLAFNCPKIGVLHQTDIRLTKLKPRLINDLNNNFNSLYCRSLKIRNYFKDNTILKISEEIVNSGIAMDKSQRKEKLLCKHNSETPIILYAGQLIKRKHVDDIILALSKFDIDIDFQFEIVGKGPERNKLEHLAEKKLKKGSYHFLGYLPREKVLEKMSEADLFVMPSTEETLGLVYLEAMSKGCICIGTKGEGIDGIIINNANGFLCQPKDADNLSSVILKALKLSQKDQEIMRMEALNTAAKYDEVEMAHNYLDLISKKEI